MKEDRVAPLKDIDRLKKRSRSRRNIVEKGGSLTLATSGLVGLFFLLVLVFFCLSFFLAFTGSYLSLTLPYFFACFSYLFLCKYILSLFYL